MRDSRDGGESSGGGAAAALRAAPRTPFGFGGDDLLGWALSEHYPRELQLQPWYRLQPRWQNASVAQLWREMHETSRHMGGCADDDGAARGGAPGCEAGGLKVRTGFIGQPSNLRATMCLLARYTGLPVHWAQPLAAGDARKEGGAAPGFYERWEAARSADDGAGPHRLSAKLNASAAAALLALSSREVLFNTLAAARFEALAAEHGCMPAGPPPPPSPPSSPPPPPSPPPFAGPPGLFVVRTHAHSGSDWLGDLLAASNVSTFFEFAGSCSSKDATPRESLDLLRRGCSCLFEEADSVNAAFRDDPAQALALALTLT